MEYYSKFYNLIFNPFGETPDPRFFFQSPSHARALDTLQESLQSGHGFSILTGEVGTGKTLTSRMLLHRIEKSWNTALILFPRYNEKDLLETICEEFEIPNLPTRPASTKDLLSALNDFLIHGAERGRKSVLIVDEAQSLPLESLESIRLLSNLESRAHKLLHIVLAAQPEFKAKLNQPEIRQLKQRIATDLALHALTARETEGYIKSRLETAGSGNFLRFDAHAILAIHGVSKGIPRRINQICETLLQAAEARKLRLIDREFVRTHLNLPPVSFFNRFFNSNSADRRFG